MTEEQLRNLAADSMAQGFIVELLLTEYLKKFGQLKFDVAKSILDAGQRTDEFVGLVKDFAEAEVFADVVVKMHQALDTYVGRALKRVAAGEKAVGAATPQ